MLCTAAEAKTLQRVHGRYNSFFRKVIPIKRVQKPVRWYTRLTVYGNPGRVVNGCAPGIPVLICGFGVVVCSGVLRRVDARPRSSPPAQGSSRCAPSCAPTGEPTLSGAPLSPCFAAESAREGTLMSLPEGAPARSGSGAESGYSKYTFGKRGHPFSQRGKAVSSVVTSGCPKRSEGGFPVGTRTITAFPSGAKLSTAFSSGTVHPPPSQASPVFPSGN